MCGLQPLLCFFAMVSIGLREHTGEQKFRQPNEQMMSRMRSQGTRFKTAGAPKKNCLMRFCEQFISLS